MSTALAQSTGEAAGLTAIPGVRVGHDTLSARPTGCTVVLVEAGAVAAVDVRGASPGTRETALLDPVNTVQEIHALVFAGGSAFGLAAADGAVAYLEERDVGYRTRVAKVPIVPAAILNDLGVGDDPTVRPTAESGYRAASAATDGPVVEGSVGAGAGATVGKLRGAERAVRGGIGTTGFELGAGVVVSALVAVNAVGDVVDPSTGAIVAGAREAASNRFANAGKLLQISEPPNLKSENTTIGVVATNMRLTKSELGLVARMAHDGLARAVRPSHTPYDGDTIFAIATGQITSDVSLLRVGALAADATAGAILRGVRAATSLPGCPSIRDLQGGAI